jgi:hypothetical protein
MRCLAATDDDTSSNAMTVLSLPVGAVPSTDHAPRDKTIKIVDDVALIVAQHGHPGRQDLSVRVNGVSMDGARLGANGAAALRAWSAALGAAAVQSDPAPRDFINNADSAGLRDPVATEKIVVSLSQIHAMTLE